MKTLITLILAATLLPAINARPQMSDRCLEWKDSSREWIAPSAQMRQTLLRGVWTKVSAPTRGDQNYHLVVRFHPNGKASYLAQERDGNYRNRLVAWQLEGHGDEVILHLGEGQHAQAYILKPFCEGVELIHATTGHVFTLNYGAPAEKGALLHRLGQLYGTWNNISHNVELRTADGSIRELDVVKLCFSLRPDGTYERQLRSGNGQELLAADRGLWELSKDGQLILFFPEGADHSQLAQVKWFELDELVLEQTLHFSDETSVAGIRDLYFNKQ